MKFGLDEKWNAKKKIDVFIHKVCRNLKDNTRKAEKVELAKQVAQRAYEAEKKNVAFETVYQLNKAKRETAKVERVNAMQDDEAERNTKKAKKAAKLAKSKESAELSEESRGSEAVEKAEKKSAKLKRRNAGDAKQRNVEVELTDGNEEAAKKASKKAAKKAKRAAELERDQGEAKQRNVEVELLDGNDEKTAKKAAKKAKKAAKLASAEQDESKEKPGLVQRNDQSNDVNGGKSNKTGEASKKVRAKRIAQVEEVYGSGKKSRTE